MKTTTNERREAEDVEYPISNKELYNLVSDAGAVDVTVADLEDFDESEFDTNGVAIPNDLSKPANLLKLLPATGDAACETGLNNRIGVQGNLFSGIGHVASPISDRALSAQAAARHRFRSLVPLVVRAYADIRNGCSTDYVLLEPEANILFLQRCWELGAAASPDDLNWTLMNARKDGKMGDLPKAKSFSIPKTELDTYSFAAEMALRYVQDRVYRDEQRELTLDKLLCNPKLATEFDELARRIVPGLTSIQYRWAAMALRKARRLPKGPMDLGLFQNPGWMEDIKPSTLPITRGLYWVEIGDRSAFVGVANNLRLQLDAFVGHLGAQVMPEWYNDRLVGKPKIRIADAASIAQEKASMLRSAVLQSCGSRLNYHDQGLFSTHGAAIRRVG